MDPVRRYQVYSVPPVQLLAFCGTALCVILLANYASFEVAGPHRLHYDFLAYTTLDHQNYDFYQDFDSISIVDRKYYSLRNFNSHLKQVKGVLDSLGPDSFLFGINQTSIDRAQHLLKGVSPTGQAFNISFTLQELDTVDFKRLFNSLSRVYLYFLVDQEKRLLLGYEYTVIEQLCLKTRILTQDDLGQFQFEEDQAPQQLDSREKPHQEHHSFTVSLAAMLSMLFACSVVGFLWELRIMHFMAQRYESTVRAGSSDSNSYLQYRKLVERYRSNKHFAAKYSGAVSGREQRLSILVSSGKQWHELGLSERLTVYSYYSVYALLIYGINIALVLILKFGGSYLSLSALLKGAGMLAFLNWMQLLRYLQFVKSRFIINFNLRSVGYWLTRALLGLSPIFVGITLLCYVLYRNITEWGDPLLIAQDFVQNLFQYGIYETLNYQPSLLFSLIYGFELFLLLYVANNIMLAIFCAHATESIRRRRLQDFFSEAQLICPNCFATTSNPPAINLTPLLSPITGSPLQMPLRQSQPQFDFKYSALLAPKDLLRIQSEAPSNRLQLLLTFIHDHLAHHRLISQRQGLMPVHLAQLRQTQSHIDRLLARVRAMSVAPQPVND